MKLRARKHLTVVAAVGALALLGPGVALAAGIGSSPDAGVAAPATGLLTQDTTAAPDLATGEIWPTGAAPAGANPAGANPAGASPAGAQVGRSATAAEAPATDPAAPLAGDLAAAPAAADPAAEPSVIDPAAAPTVIDPAAVPTAIDPAAAPAATDPAVAPSAIDPPAANDPAVVAPDADPAAATPAVDPVAAPADEPAAAAPATPAEPDSAAERYGWGAPLPQSDEFNYTGQPDASKWVNIDGCWSGHDGNGQRCGANSTVDGEKLIQKGNANGDTGWLASKLDQQYGRWEARVRSFNDGDSGNEYHPLLIVWPSSDSWPNDGEYDFLENQAPGEDCANAFIHYPHPNMPVEQEFLDEKDCGAPLSEWHNIAFEWTPDHVRGYIDGKEWYTLKDGDGPGGRSKIQGMPSGKLTIQFDNFYGGGMREASYEIDWVRMYTLEPQAIAGDASAGPGGANTPGASAGPGGAAAGDTSAPGTPADVTAPDAPTGTTPSGSTTGTTPTDSSTTGAGSTGTGAADTRTTGAAPTGAGTSGAGTSGAGTTGAGTSGAGTSGADATGAGTSGAGASGAGTSAAPDESTSTAA
jgi:hypothetical protein